MRAQVLATGALLLWFATVMMGVIASQQQGITSVRMWAIILGVGAATLTLVARDEWQRQPPIPRPRQDQFDELLNDLSYRPPTR